MNRRHREDCVSVEHWLPGDPCDRIPFFARKSLLDADIVIFSPKAPAGTLTTHQYLGKPSLSESASFKLKEAANHWRRELRSALEVGKSVVVFLTDETEMYIDTGERRYSGTGRNRQTTNLVEPFSTYSQLPIDLAAIASVGSKMKLVPGDEWLNGYWTQFGDRSEYRAILTNSDLTPAITTASGDKTVGG